ncbi:MAG TPA: hypothetical protein VEC17_03200 [Candidatus Binatia bacterium]|nr:hypothetical protein [Candidatus Binatia bacterium]
MKKFGFGLMLASSCYAALTGYISWHQFFIGWNIVFVAVLVISIIITVIRDFIVPQVKKVSESYKREYEAAVEANKPFTNETEYRIHLDLEDPERVPDIQLIER